jgi:hypothetical protein
MSAAAQGEMRMSEPFKTEQPQANPQEKMDQLCTSNEETNKSSRRELIQRYAKYAIAAGPLLLFVSKAYAIHSKP